MAESWGLQSLRSGKFRGSRCEDKNSGFEYYCTVFDYLNRFSTLALMYSIGQWTRRICTLKVLSWNPGTAVFRFVGIILSIAEYSSTVVQWGFASLVVIAISRRKGGAPRNPEKLTYKTCIVLERVPAAGSPFLSAVQYRCEKGKRVDSDLPVVGDQWLANGPAHSLTEPNTRVQVADSERDTAAAKWYYSDRSSLVWAFLYSTVRSHCVGPVQSWSERWRTSFIHDCCCKVPVRGGTVVQYPITR